MKTVKTLLVASLPLISLGVNALTPQFKDVKTGDTVRVATFNVSFDRNSPETLENELLLNRAEQDMLLKRLAQNDPALTKEEKATAQHVQQIRNVAEIVQRVRPDIFVLNEFDYNTRPEAGNIALKNFVNNYLAVAQKEKLKGIPFATGQVIPTNTGLQSGFDLDNDGKTGTPNDAFGFGKFTGHYAFAILSQFPIDAEKTRSFQQFKQKDLKGASNPVIDDCNNVRAKIPQNKACGDQWYSDDAWNNFRLSSKNHVDIPVKVGKTSIHMLLSHPTPPVFNNAARHNLKRNRDELNFWAEYLNNQDYLTDDQGKKGGLAPNEAFVIAGDLNADPIVGDGDKNAIIGLYSHKRVNQNVANGDLLPTSKGAVEFLASEDARRNKDRANPEQITHHGGMRLDYVLPSANLNAVASGVFWPKNGEEGSELVRAKIDGKIDTGKKVSSDHRMVWVDLKVE
ncbi:3-phytase (myo-inositol-hexaphosphate 3-phosphohydrolase) [Phocoenobacter uteri]|uniref:3-phytase (Myo-inositol-hexaphosphate 3-phosphohydrolase) n=1 Tax=Phocoenobacter uteri TaxID=146806 RepID=A0A379C9H9_9PAST|nr:endonuclease/exonuclease/phosphatase family protein [Phocoenobacter uteri]MDG6882615.1 succinyl-CoA synthetase subunit alpha [Phocoenobacter uteri]SUB58778.1 3-phytase (myo-inositol-hexaphosphate 3-phosphohydrolase) [Phocoenobacter uteri]